MNIFSDTTNFVVSGTYICINKSDNMKNIVLLTRYLLIINKLQKSGSCTAKELLQQVNNGQEYRGHPADISLRTLERDIILT